MDNYQNYTNLGMYGNEPADPEEEDMPEEVKTEEKKEFDKLKVRSLLIYLLQNETLSLSGTFAIKMIGDELDKI